MDGQATHSLRDSETADIVFDVDGMSCAGCASRLQRVLNELPEVAEADVNYALERAQVTPHSASDHLDRIKRAGKDAGFALTPRLSGARSRDMRMTAAVRDKAREGLRNVMMSGVLTAPLVLAMFLPMLDIAVRTPFWLQIALATPVQFWFGRQFYVGAFKAVRSGGANMDVLVALGTTSAYMLSVWIGYRDGFADGTHLYFEASAVIITLILTGRYIEARAKLGTTAAVRGLMELRAETARVVQARGVIELPVAEVSPGDIVVVRPGERVPVDGLITSGSTDIDLSHVTGESMPVPKQAGDALMAGSLNGTSEVRIQATRIGEDSTIARMIRLVEQAQFGKAPVQELVDRISAVFVPIVLMIAGLTVIVWMALGAGPETAIINAVSVLVIACPCALGLATPTAIVAGTGAAARAGILIKDVAVIENAAKADIVAFDKTGTVTQGEPRVTSVRTLGVTEDEVLFAAGSVQQGSEHPLARAVLAEADRRGIRLATANGVRAIVGSGIMGNVDGVLIRIGSREFLQSEGLSVIDDLQVGEGETSLFVSRADVVLGVFGVRDTLRPESLEAVQALRRMNLRSVILTGDNESAAKAIGPEVGVDDVRAELKPNQKVAAFDDWREAGSITLMVGDGINDAPALAAADVGIAMGSGSDAAIETAGITLMRPDPRLVAAAIDLARATWRRVKWNLFWAFVFNSIGLPLAAFGLLNPMVAGAAMAMSSIAVVTNSMMLRHWRPYKMETTA